VALNALEEKFRRVVDAAGSKLIPAGFLKQGKSFRRTTDLNACIVEFQRSAVNNASLIRFTLNLGIVSARLLHAWDPDRDLKKVAAAEAHLRERIGFLRDPPIDHWWSLEPGTDETAVAAEVATLLVDAALPFFGQYGTDQSLLALWRTGRSPGLTEVQRERFLSLMASS